MPSASPLTLLLVLGISLPGARSQDPGSAPAERVRGASRSASDRLVHPGHVVFRPGAPPRLATELAKPLLRGGRLEPGYFLVHFRSPVTREDRLWLDELTGPVRRADGSELARGYVPDDALVAWVERASTLLALRRSARTDWVDRYQPGYKLDPSIALDAREDAALLLDVDLVPGHPGERVRAELEALGARVREHVYRRGSRTHDLSFLIVEAAPRSLVPLLHVEGIRAVQPRADAGPFSISGSAGELDSRRVAALEWQARTGHLSGPFPGIEDGARYGQTSALLDLLALDHPQLSTCMAVATIDSSSLELPLKNALLVGGAPADALESIQQRLERSLDLGWTAASRPSGALQRALWIHDAGVDPRTTGSTRSPGQRDGVREERWIVGDVPSADGFVSPDDPGDEHVFHGSGAGEPLAVTLAWTDEPASPGARETGINDLDLVVRAPDGTTYRGRAPDGGAESSPRDLRDPGASVEIVHLVRPAGGAWTVTVQPVRGAFSVGQGYALVVSGLAPGGSHEELTVPTTVTLAVSAGQHSKDGALGAADLGRLRASDDDRFSLRDREQLTLALERTVPADAIVSAVRVLCEHQEQPRVSPGDILWKLGQGSLASPSILESTGAPLRGGDTLDVWSPDALALDPNGLVVVIENESTDDDTLVDHIYVEVDYVLPVFAPHITSTPSAEGVVGQGYAYDADERAEASGSAPLAWSLVSGPTGFSIHATTGAVTWTPDSAGSIPITIQATNTHGSESQSFVVEVLPLPRTLLPSNPTPIDYCPPERLALGPAAPQQKLNVFLPRGEPPPFGWPVVLNNRAGGGVAALPLGSIRDTGRNAPLHAFVADGIAVVDFGVTSIGNGAGLFYPPGHPSGRHESFQPLDDNPEKEAEWAVQWLKTQDLFALDAHRTCLRGSSHGAIISIWAAMGPERARASGSPQVRASTRVKAVLALQPPTSVWAFDQGPELAVRMLSHFEQAAFPGVPATAFGQVAERLQKDASVMGFAFDTPAARDNNETQALCLLYGEPVKMVDGVVADMTLAADGFPVLHDTLGNPFIHDSWAGYILYRRLLELSPRSAAFHGDHSLFGVRDTSALAPPHDFHTVTYPGGVFGSGAAAIAHEWVLRTLGVRNPAAASATR